MPYLREWMSPDFGPDSGTTLGRQPALGHVPTLGPDPWDSGTQVPGTCVYPQQRPEIRSHVFCIDFPIGRAAASVSPDSGPPLAPSLGPFGGDGARVLDLFGLWRRTTQNRGHPFAHFASD